jgi:hypothetical protein
MPRLTHRRRVTEKRITYVGLDVPKDTIALALADRRGEVREHGKSANTPTGLKTLAAKLLVAEWCRGWCRRRCGREFRSPIYDLSAWPHRVDTILGGQPGDSRCVGYAQCRLVPAVLRHPTTYNVGYAHAVCSDETVQNLGVLTPRDETNPTRGASGPNLPPPRGIAVRQHQRTCR